MDRDLSEMARQCFGYGRWEAPYWFIGPEQGQAPAENDDLLPRLRAWHGLGRGELNDCRSFHALIGEKRWHRELPRLQPTWRPLLLLLMTFLGRPTDNESLRRYQRDSWGTLTGEACVIELSGLAAHSLKVNRERECFREERITVIRARIHQHKPALVVMYGLSQSKDWNAIAGQTFPPDNILKVGPTILAVTPHPTSHGIPNTYWTQLGMKLRRFCESSAQNPYGCKHCTGRPPQ